MLIPQLVLMDIPVREFTAGEMLIEEGDPGTSVFVLEDGEVSVVIDGNPITTVDRKGAIFGEMSALLGRSRSATVTTTTESSFYVIEDLMTFLRQHPEMSLFLLKLLAQRVDGMNMQITEKKRWWQVF